MHHRLVRDVAVGEDDLIHAGIPAQRLEVALLEDRNAFGIQGSGERGGIPAAGDAGDLRRGERYDLDRCIVAEHDVEVVEIAACRAQDKNAPAASALAHAGSPRADDTGASWREAP